MALCLEAASKSRLETLRVKVSRNALKLIELLLDFLSFHPIGSRLKTQISLEF